MRLKHEGGGGGGGGSASTAGSGRGFRIGASTDLRRGVALVGHASGKVQLWHLVKAARVVCGKKTKAEGWPQQLKVNIPSGYDNVNLIWSSRG